MKRKTLVLLSICFLLSTIAVLALFEISKTKNHKYNSFVRLFPPHPIKNEQTFDIKYNSYYIAGATKQNIYLGNETAPLHLLKISSSFIDTSHIKLSIENVEKYRFGSIQVKVDSPYFYITDGYSPSILRGSLLDWTAKKYMYDSAFFTECVPLQPTSFAIRTLSTRTKEYVLGKEQIDSPHVKLYYNLLEKQIDGIFCTDGVMTFDRELKRLVYVYYYRNQYICMDSNLTLLYRARTIDTISHVKIKTAKIKSDNSLTMSAPPLLVNKQSCASSGLLFVHSNLMAKNETIEAFEMASVIDVYNLNDGTYKLSFYLPNYNNQKMTNFMVCDGRVIVLYDHYILSYNLHPKYFHS